MNVELKGTIKLINKEEKVTDNLTVQEVVITIDEDSQYPQDIVCRAVNSKIESIKPFKEGDKVIASVDLRGRENKGKFYNQLVMWNIKNQ